MKLESTSYRVSVGQPMSNSTFLVQLAYRKPDGTIGYASVATDGGTINNLTIQDINNNAGFGLIIREGTSFDNMLIKPMLQLATTSYDFEPYTGGMPSPNPDYPQNIKVVKGNNTVKISGANLVDENNLTAKPSSPVEKIENNIVTSTAMTVASSSTASGPVVLFPPFKPQVGEYFISAEIRLVSGTINGNISAIQMWADSTWSASASWITRPTNISSEFQRYVRKYTISDIGSVNNVVNAFYVQTLGADNAVIEFKNIQISKDNVNYEPYSTPITKQLNLGNLELCKIGDYQDFFYKNNGNWYKRQVIASRTFNGTENFQIGAASNDDYYIFQTAYRYDLSDKDFTVNDAFSNRFVCVGTEAGNINANKEQIAFNSNAQTYLRFTISATRLTEKSISAFQTWLSSNNVLVYYVLANPVNIQITDATLINQLEELNKVIGQGGTVVIETESKEENAQLIVNASALQKI